MPLAVIIIAALAVAFAALLAFAYVYWILAQGKRAAASLPLGLGRGFIPMIEFVMYQTAGWIAAIETPLYGMSLKARAALGHGITEMYRTLSAPLQSLASQTKMEHDALWLWVMGKVWPLAVQTKMEHDALWQDVEGRLSPALDVLRQQHNALWEFTVGRVWPLAVQTKMEHDALWQDVEGRLSPALETLRQQHNALWRYTVASVGALSARVAALEQEAVAQRGRIETLEGAVAGLLPLGLLAVLPRTAIMELEETALNPCRCLDFGSFTDLEDRVNALEIAAG